MRLVSTADLKNHTNEVLRTVLTGEPVVVTRHGRPVASLLRIEDADLTALAMRQRRADPVPGRETAGYHYAAFPLPFGVYYVAFGPKGPAFARIAPSARAFERDAKRYLGVAVTRVAPPRWLADALTAAVKRHQPFDGPVDLARLGPFEREVLAELRRIPAGQTRTYQQVALALGEPGAARAVGAACARNPVPLLIPCHRVVRSDGGLGGYSLRGGVELKRRLLRDEGAITNLFA
ncbi:MAG: type II toxin-antitoxin system prevent-host-death family antitoxin [Armatimonadota bacterium]|nr:type II toxin-antitoxin system prevent-host-death family antitoxin [Armatimonadota bacterium]